MKYAYDFRQIALDSLDGNWKTAALTSVVSYCLGAVLFTRSNVSLSSVTDLLKFVINDPDYVELGFIPTLLITVLFVAIILLFIFGVAQIVLGGVTTLGYAKYNLNLVDKKEAKFSDLFSQFNRFGAGFLMRFLTSLYLVLWSMLFFIVGIVKTYSYAVTPFILLEHPELTVNEAITESRRIMNGNRWRLFCLEFSFIGWRILTVLPAIFSYFLVHLGDGGIIAWFIISTSTLIVGNILVNAFFNVAFAAFYREITNIPVYKPREISDHYENKNPI